MAHSTIPTKIQIHVDPDLQEFLPKYIQNRTADLALLTKFFNNGNLKEIKTISHKIRGHATSYGMEPLGEICKKMEAAAQNGETDEIGSLLAQFKEYLSRIQLP